VGIVEIKIGEDTKEAKVKKGG